MVVIDSDLDLGPFRLERGMGAREHGYAYTLHELKAAFGHGCGCARCAGGPSEPASAGGAWCA